MSALVEVLEIAFAEARAAIGTLREWGANDRAAAVEKAIEFLQHRVHELMSEPLALDTAAEESGYSPDHLGRLVREGTLPNAGEPYAPRIRRRDLPRRPGHGNTLADATGSGAPSRTEMARSVVAST